MSDHPRQKALPKTLHTRKQKAKRGSAEQVRALKSLRARLDRIECALADLMDLATAIAAWQAALEVRVDRVLRQREAVAPPIPPDPPRPRRGTWGERVRALVAWKRMNQRSE